MGITRKLGLEPHASISKVSQLLRFFELDNLFSDSYPDRDFTFSRIAYLVDFLGRVIVGYGFYQTIQAFRRYGQK